MPEFLVTGAGGMLGRSWARRLEREGIDYHGASHQALDITDAAAIEAAVVAGTKWVINCAAWTDVDGAETHPDAAHAANATAVGYLAERCNAVGAKLVHYSTDYVFDGTVSAPYATDHPRHPVNEYGRSKAEGEALLEKSDVDHLLIRSSWLYAPWGKNFVLTMRDLVRSRPSLRVVDDQRGRPSSCDQIAESTFALIRSGHLGTFHVCDEGECTWFELASHVRDLVNPDCTIEPCSSEEFPRPAPRPAYSVLDLSGTEHAIGRAREWRAQVAEALQQASE